MATGPDQEPSWVDYTGGDSLYSTVVTDAAVYVGGHQRWLNNPSGRDLRGPGGVGRPGMISTPMVSRPSARRVSSVKWPKRSSPTVETMNGAMPSARHASAM